MNANKPTNPLPVLYYIHDPMCSWCWAFRPVWIRMQALLPDDVAVKCLLGGLAADSNVVMDAETQAMIRRHWRVIEKRVPGTRFNDDFWTRCSPRRSTYPACRAVIAARQQDQRLEDAMIFAIQQAYYLQARNPSDEDVLIDLALSIGLDRNQFHQDLHAPDIQAAFMQEMHMARHIGAHSFPSLIYKSHGGYRAIPVDYNHADVMIAHL